MANNLYHTSKFSGEEIDDAVSRVLDSENTNAVATKNELKTKADLVDGKVPASQLPSYVDDAIEGYLQNGVFYEDDSYSVLITPESGKIYIDKNSDKTYRWGGSTYVSLNDVDMTNYPIKTEMDSAISSATTAVEDKIPTKVSQLTNDSRYLRNGEDAKFATMAVAGINIDSSYDENGNLNGLWLFGYKGNTAEEFSPILRGVGTPIEDIDAVNKAYVDGLVADIETGLDNIISIQNALIGGDA